MKQVQICKSQRRDRSHLFPWGGSMTGLDQQENDIRSTPAFRLDVRLHDLLKQPGTARPLKLSLPSAQPQTLPTPVFPQHPGLLTDEELEADKHGSPSSPYGRRWTVPL